MKLTFKSLCCVGLFCLLFAAAGRADETVALFDGKSLDHWVVTNCKVEIQDGALLLKEGNGLVQSKEKYADFTLTWDCKNLAAEKYDAGVYVRFDLPLPKGRPWPKQYQVNLKQNEEGNFVGDVKGGTSKGLYKPGEWNSFKLTVKGTTAALEMNGKPAWKVDGLKSLDGHIGLQCETPAGGQFLIRDVKLTKLTK